MDSDGMGGGGFEELARTGAARDAVAAMGDGGGCWTGGSVAGFTGGIVHYGTGDPAQRRGGAVADSHGFGPPGTTPFEFLTINGRLHLRPHQPCPHAST